MAIELHHLHPSHDDELTRLKARIAELEKENAELKEQYRDMDVTHTVHIAKMNALIEELEESQRWRKFSEEKPNDKEVVLVHGEEWFETAIYHDDGSIDFGDDIHFSNITEAPYWMPLPSAPKEEK